MSLKEEDIEFKNQLTGLDWINAQQKEIKEILTTRIRLLAMALIKPKLSYEEVLALPIRDFHLLLGKFMKDLGVDLFGEPVEPPEEKELVTSLIQNNKEKPVYHWKIPMSRMDDKEIEHKSPEE